MSKSYARYLRMGIGVGSNTEYYRYRLRKFRNKNRHRIRNLLANHPVAEFDYRFVDFRQPRRDDWREPTDGTWIYTYKDIIEGHNEEDEDLRCLMNLYTTKNRKVKK